MFKLPPEMLEAIEAHQNAGGIPAISVHEDGTHFAICLGIDPPVILARVWMPGLTLRNAEEYLLPIRAAIREATMRKGEKRYPMGITIQQHGGKKAFIRFPYNQLFLDAFKAAIPSARWVPQQEVWEFDSVSIPEAEAVINHLYGQPTKLLQLTWKDFQAANISIMGFTLFWVRRDRWSWDRRVPLSFRVITEILRTGGSAKYPHIRGDLTIEIEIAENAVIDPAPTTCQIVRKED